MKRRIIVFSIPILILMSMTIPLILTLTQGTEIILKTIPIDPEDLFRGDYVSLNYEISEIDKGKLSTDLKENFPSEADDYSSIKVYTSLEKDADGYFKVKSVSLKKPQSDIYLKGSLYRYREYEEYIVNKDTPYEDYQEKFKYVYHIDYNIDKYFVPENSGRKFEKASEKGNILAVIKIYKGHALLKEVRIK